MALFSSKGKKSYGTIMLSMSVVNLLFMHTYIMLTCQVEESLDWTSFADCLFRVLFDVWVIVTLALAISFWRIKAALVSTFVITLVWAFANVLYSRFFFHYLSLSSMSEAGAMADEMVFDSMLAGLKWIDLYFVAMAAAFIPIARKPVASIGIKKYFNSSAIVLVGLLVIDLMMHIVFCAIRPELRYVSYYTRRVGERIFGKNHPLALPIFAYFHNGSVKSLCIEAIMNLQDNIEITEQQKVVIEKQLDNARSSLTRNEKLPIDNVIFILIESQMSYVIDKVIGQKEITPCLNALKRDSCVYYNGEVHPNITIGESADGQYIYMTGLLPLRSMITVTKAHQKPLPGLPKQLRKAGINNSRMILPTPSSIWRQDDMCRQYGFDRLYAINDYPSEHSSTLTDEQIFELAAIADEKECCKGRFFSIILTASMHQPYNKTLDPSFTINDPSINKELKSYMNACHYTDRAIGNYLDGLKEKGLYDKSLIVIASDHHVHSTDFGGGISTDIPLFIINGGIGNEAYNGPCNQLDIYTTIIDILGISDAWPGLGHSLLNNKYEVSVTPTNWNVSEQILLSDFLTHYTLAH